MIIGVDVDDTYVDMRSLWWRYLEGRFHRNCTRNIPYNISGYFILPEGVDGLEFWRDHNLYAGLTPMAGAVECLTELSNRGNEIVFVTKPKGLHHKSKYYFLENTLPCMDGAIMTHEKYYARVDVMIDDNLNVLAKMKERNPNLVTVWIRPTWSYPYNMPTMDVRSSYSADIVITGWDVNFLPDYLEEYFGARFSN